MDRPILKSIQRLTADERRLSEQEMPTDTDYESYEEHSKGERNILDRARPLLDQHSIEIQPYGMIAKLPLLWPENSLAMPNGFWVGGDSGRPERWRHDGSRWVAAEPSRYGFCVWGYDNDTPEVVRLGVNLSGLEVERLADLFLAVEKAVLEAEGAAHH
jgi:hypothetical protein